MAVSVALQKKFEDFHLHLAFEQAGSRLGILGASGCGKSMALRCIAGIERPDAGRIVLNGRVLYDSEQGIDLPPQKRSVGYLFQNYALFPHMTVEENIGAGVRKSREERREIVAGQVKKFRLEGLEKRYPSQLSGGQQQRVALARIMAYRPELLLLDEPFSALDRHLKDELQYQLLATLSEYEGDVILVTHSRDEVYKFCPRLLVMKEGRSVILGETKELFVHPVKAEAAKLIGCKNIAAIRRLSAHRMEIPAWGMILNLEREIGEEIRYVGVSAHELIPRWEEPKQGGMPFQAESCVELPFEKQYLLKNGMRWHLRKDRRGQTEGQGLPGWLEIPEEKLLLLEE